MVTENKFVSAFRTCASYLLAATGGSLPSLVLHVGLHNKPLTMAALVGGCLTSLGTVAAFHKAPAGYVENTLVGIGYTGTALSLFTLWATSGYTNASAAISSAAILAGVLCGTIAACLLPKRPDISQTRPTRSLEAR
ncbi:MAG: hypothetical protein PHW63_02390 [Alphaproteobacteria bacterium]|nr:hypothetical protein [Alphaproteobacteria bacterium]